MKLNHNILSAGILVSALLALASCSEPPAVDVETSKAERNAINSGNRNFNDSNFIASIADYQRAIATNPSNPVSQFNLAAARYAELKKQGLAHGSEANSPDRDTLLSEVSEIYSNLAKNSAHDLIVEKSSYNHGNLLFNNNDYQGSINQYKEALRRNPQNDSARINLRIAQLKLQQQQSNNSDNQDQQQEQQQQQEQPDNKDQQKDQQQQQQNQQQNQQQQNQQQNQQHQKGADNSEQILKAMENAESSTRNKVNEKEAKEQQQSRRNVAKPW